MAKTIQKCGREWEISSTNYDIINDNDWWCVGKFSEGILYMNNNIGVMLLVQKDDTILECYI